MCVRALTAPSCSAARHTLMQQPLVVASTRYRAHQRPHTAMCVLILVDAYCCDVCPHTSRRILLCVCSHTSRLDSYCLVCAHTCRRRRGEDLINQDISAVEGESSKVLAERQKAFILCVCAHTSRLSRAEELMKVLSGRINESISALEGES